MGRSVELAIAALISLSGLTCTAQTPLEQQPANPTPTPGLPNAGPSLPRDFGNSTKSPAYQDLDLLRRDGFAGAEEASVSLRITDKTGATPAALQISDFTLIVNGTKREGRLHTPGSKTTEVAPLVLLVFPPNEPVVHHLAALQAIAYFSHEPNELLPWRVGIYDANKKTLPFTNGRSQLLAYLDVVEHSPSPFLFIYDPSWLLGAEAAIGVMQRYEGPKVILAMNPLRSQNYSPEFERMLASVGPEFLTPIAQRIGAHMYIANVGGPDTIVPGGGAADDQVAQVNTLGGPQLGTTPSSHMQVDPKQIAALNNAAYNTSQMMQSAANTLGGFSNSLKDLAVQIHRDLDGNYALDFDLTPEDRDHGVPAVEVRFALRDLKIAILDVAPVSSASDSYREAASKRLTALLAEASKHPVSSPDFRITQHVDYFPLREGLEPVLPMSCLVEWAGLGHGPAQLYVAESVEDQNLGTTILQKNITAQWDGRSLTWERDGQLRPGRYVWSVAVHDGNGKILSSAQEKVNVDFPHDPPVAVSSLVVGKSCRNDDRKVVGLRQRPTADSSGKDQAERPRLQIDPMRAADCRIQPESTDRFDSTDVLHALVRIYPADKFDKHGADNWTAKFLLRSQSGSIEKEEDLPFTIDSGSGYLAAIQMPLNVPGISSGQHTLDVEMRGPGIHSELKESRSISIQPSSTPTTASRE